MGGSTDAKTTTNNHPWAGAHPYLKDILSQAKSMYGEGAGTGVYNGPVLSPMDPRTVQGMSMTEGAANKGGILPAMNKPFQSLTDIATGGANGGFTPGGGKAAGLLGNFVGTNAPTASFSYLNKMAQGDQVGKNPYIDSIADANAARVGNRVNSAMSGAGRYGSFAHGDALTRSISEANNPMYAQAYEADRNRQIQAASQIDSAGQGANAQRIGAANSMGALDLSGSGQALQAKLGDTSQQMQAGMGLLGSAPALNELVYDPARRIGQMGEYMQGRGQAGLDDLRRQFNETNAMPWQQLQKYMGIVGPMGGMGGVNVSTQPGPSPWMQAGGLGLGAASLFGSAAGGTSAAAGLGSAAASTLPYLAMLSDRNEKTDIKRVGESKTTGLPIYSYRYKGDSKSYPKVVGPMAQDIRDRFPWATAEVDGKLVVKPEGIGLLGAL